MDKILKIEITDYCNAKCVFCNYNRTNTHMPYETVVSIVEQLPEVEWVEPQHLGEPLLHPRFVDILRYLKEKNKYIAFHTNGSLLKGDVAEEIAEIAPDLIRFSVEGDNKELFEGLRVGLKWDIVLDNITKFQEMKSDKTETQIVMLETKEVKPHIERVVEFWKDKVDAVRVTPENPHYREVKGQTRQEPLVCWKVEKMITVKVDGSIILCCQDWNSDYVIGHINDGIKNVVEGTEATRLKEVVRKGEALSICKRCSVYWEGE